MVCCTYLPNLKNHCCEMKLKKYEESRLHNYPGKTSKKFYVNSLLNQIWFIIKLFCNNALCWPLIHTLFWSDLHCLCFIKISWNVVLSMCVIWLNRWFNGQMCVICLNRWLNRQTLFKSLQTNTAIVTTFVFQISAFLWCTGKCIKTKNALCIYKHHPYPHFHFSIFAKFSIESKKMMSLLKL